MVGGGLTAVGPAVWHVPKILVMQKRPGNLVNSVLPTFACAPPLIYIPVVTTVTVVPDKPRGTGRAQRGERTPATREKPLRQLTKKFVSFMKKEDGPTAVEYAVMLALIIVVCIAAITTLGSNANNTFSSVATKAAPAGGS